MLNLINKWLNLMNMMCLGKKKGINLENEDCM